MAKIRDRTVSVSRLTGPRVEVLRATYRTAQDAVAVPLIKIGIDPYRPDLEVRKDTARMLRVVSVRRETDPRRLLPSPGRLGPPNGLTLGEAQAFVARLFVDGKIPAAEPERGLTLTEEEKLRNQADYHEFMLRLQQGRITPADLGYEDWLERRRSYSFQPST